MASALPDAASMAANNPDIDNLPPETKAFGHRFVDAIADHARHGAARLR
jgi:hypothetical protein